MREYAAGADTTSMVAQLYRAHACFVVEYRKLTSTTDAMLLPLLLADAHGYSMARIVNVFSSASPLDTRMDDTFSPSCASATHANG